MDLFNLKTSYISQFWEIFVIRLLISPASPPTFPFSLSGTLIITVWDILGCHLIFLYFLYYFPSLWLYNLLSGKTVIFNPPLGSFISIIFIFISSLFFSNVPFYSILYLFYGCNVYLYLSEDISDRFFVFFLSSSLFLTSCFFPFILICLSH